MCLESCADLFPVLIDKLESSLLTIATVVRTFAMMRYLQDPAFAILPYRKSFAIDNTKVSNPSPITNVLLSICQHQIIPIVYLF